MRIHFFIIFFFLASFCIAQKDSTSFAKNTVFFGVGEFGLSINYDRIIFKKYNDKIALRIGTGPFLISRGIMQHGLGVTYFYGRNHNIAIGVGVFYGNDLYERCPIYPQDDCKYAALFSLGKLSYRYQRVHGGFFGEAGIFLQHQVLKLHSYRSLGIPTSYPNRILPSISIGYSF